MRDLLAGWSLIPLCLIIAHEHVPLGHVGGVHRRVAPPVLVGELPGRLHLWAAAEAHGGGSKERGRWTVLWSRCGSAGGVGGAVMLLMEMWL